MYERNNIELLIPPKKHIFRNALHLFFIEITGIIVIYIVM